MGRSKNKNKKKRKEEISESETPEEEEEVETKVEEEEEVEYRGWIENYGEKLAPAFRILILAFICMIAIGARVFSVIRYESVIHEFDPWFNYRATRILSEKGFYAFKYWIDQESWYPLGRYSGFTLFPGLMLTAWTMHNILNHILLFPIDIREVCVFTAPVFSAFTSICTYLITKEISGNSGAGLLSALFMAIIPSYMSRSVAGSYDNEAVAIFALVFSFYTFVRAVNKGGLFSGFLAALGFYYMILTWGGYVFVLGVISIYIIGLIIVEKFNAKVYIAFSIFYIIGNLLALTLPFVSVWAVWQSSEHLPSHIAFIVMNIYMLNSFVKSHLSKEKYNFLSKAVIRATIFIVLAGFLYIVVMGKTTAGHRILTLINPVYAQKHNPLVASISEHQPTAWSSFFFDLQLTLIFAPIGIYVCLKKVNNAKLFITLYGMLAIYFSSVMIRLLLAAAPACCILSGIGLSHVIQEISSSIRQEIYSLGGVIKKKKKKIPLEFGLIGLGLIGYLACRVIFHGTWSGAEAYSHPSIIMCKKNNIFSQKFVHKIFLNFFLKIFLNIFSAYRDRGGNRKIIDDYREAYYWLRRNTKTDAKVMSWWDYGYQIAGMGNRTTLVDNNTWNKTHIGRVGMAMGSREEEAHEIATSMDVDYVLVIFGGLSGYSGDDINKFLWMVRIGGSENPHIKESDYFGGGQYRVDSGGSKTMLNCLMYKLCYFRFGEIDQGRGRGYDVQRRAIIGVKKNSFIFFEKYF